MSIIVVIILAMVANYLPHSGIISMLMGIIGAIAFLFIFVLNISLFVRRWHDIDQSGFMLILHFVPFVNLIAIAYVLLKQGNPNTNNYGIPPSREIKFPVDILKI